MTEESSAHNKSENYKAMFEKIIDKGAKAFQHGGETIETAINSALSLRDNVIMVRINKESLTKIDELIDSGLFKNRSECAAFLIREGIKARIDIFGKIEEKISEIQRLKNELKDIVDSEIKNESQEDTPPEKPAEEPGTEAEQL